MDWDEARESIKTIRRYLRDHPGIWSQWETDNLPAIVNAYELNRGKDIGERYTQISVALTKIQLYERGEL